MYGELREENRRQTGGRYEEMTARWLTAEGFRILERNFRCRFGEIDLIAMEEDELAFIEVKYRHSGIYGRSEEAVDHRKQRIISRVAEFYVCGHPWADRMVCRFDVAAFEDGRLHYYRNAFGGI